MFQVEVGVDHQKRETTRENQTRGQNEHGRDTHDAVHEQTVQTLFYKKYNAVFSHLISPIPF